MCAAFADALADGQSVFGRLMYVQRNWDADDDYGKRPKQEFHRLVSGAYI